MSKTKRAENSKTSHDYPGYLMFLSMMMALLGVLLLFVPQFQIVYIAYTVGLILVVLGIILIVRYFLKESYRNINQYDFSIGVMLVSLGILMLLNAKVISGYFLLVLGIGILMLTIVQLQNALDLKAMQDKLWSVLLFLALASLICAMVILSNPFQNQANLERFTYIILIVEGLLSLFSTLCLTVRIQKYGTDIQTVGETKANTERENEAEAVQELQIMEEMKIDEEI